MKYIAPVTVKSLVPKATAIAVMLSTAALLSGCSPKVDSSTTSDIVRPVYVELASNTAIADLSFNGTIHSASRAELSFRTSGRLVEVLVQEGDYVEKNQLIAKLDDADAKIALSATEIELNNARSEYLRAKTLFENQQSISKSQFEELTLRFSLAKNQHKEAIRRLEDTALKAPFSGVVSRRFVDNHVLVQSNEAIVVLHDLNDLEAVIHVPETLMTRNTQVGQIYAQSTIAPFEQFNLSLKKYETEPDSVTGTYAVTFTVHTDAQSRLLPGMNVHVFSAEVHSDSQTIQIPLSAISPDNMGQQFIWIVDEQNTLQKRQVVTGSLSGERVNIQANLAVGEQVVISGTQNLQVGLLVRPEQVEVN
ncbi:efflux RND transporter periplasmic adaptor subunit [Shewanella waksmanii]|uniref:efflux RND transporter periplasmic adaptor subunit n=1 Tax=Shewanella waksmanii TaxID=213783 RepID=UPI0037369E98